MILSWVKLHYLSLMQNSLIFKPIHNKILPTNNPDIYKLTNTKDVYLTTEDDVKIHLWHHKSTKKNAPIFICFHGNTGSWVDVGAPKPHEDYDRFYRLELLKEVQDQGAGFISVSMRGFGKSAHSAPSESGFSKDLDAVIEYLHDQHITSHNIILLGESLGAAVAYMLAEKLSILQNPARLLAAIASFSSMSARVHQTHPDLATTKIEEKLRHTFNSFKRTSNLSKSTALYLFHGADDDVTLPCHSQNLYEEAQRVGLNARYDVLENTQHIDWNATAIIKKSLEFYHEIT